MALPDSVGVRLAAAQMALASLAATSVPVESGGGVRDTSPSWAKPEGLTKLPPSKRIKRNAPCPCGCGRKWKKCRAALAVADEQGEAGNG